ncbi:hypothetical protein E2C01_071688 [Portunus trituberculatus]|uniref:Uncharacterized protein n=1 Tax=Portunus trituberculatus TaxID=210409 RepID=A0A5B7I5R3_PORTR|nr:hypothetical protein [Portunus trituberculatus]
MSNLGTFMILSPEGDSEAGLEVAAHNCVLLASIQDSQQLIKDIIMLDQATTSVEPLKSGSHRTLDLLDHGKF